MNENLKKDKIGNWVKYKENLSVCKKNTVNLFKIRQTIYCA